MTTKLEGRLEREYLLHNGKTMIVALLPEGVEYRLKRGRKRFLLPHPLAFLKAVQLATPPRKARVKRGLLSV